MSRKKFAHLEIRLENILMATNYFDDRNVVHEDGFGKAYKGELLKSGELIGFVAWRLDQTLEQNHVQFWRTISVLYNLKHKNIISNIGFCDDNHEMIIINKHEVNGSLDKYLSDSTTLTWLRRLQICVGVAQALSYLHYDVGRDFSVIHRDIKSSRIFLDENWEPKLSGFELSMNTSAAQRNRAHITKLCGTYGYHDPEYSRTLMASHKSDVYSFGIVLFEVLCGRMAFDINRKYGDDKFLGKSAKFHYENKKLDDIIDPGLRKQMDLQSLNIFSETAYCCLKEPRSQRPNIDQILIKLEEALELQRIHENPVQYSMVNTGVEGTSSRSWSWKEQNLAHLKIPLSDILLATKNFTQEIIGEGGFAKVYKAELDHFDSNTSLSTDEKNKGILPKRHSTVAIKCISDTSGELGEQGFDAEIRLLSSCNHPNIVSLLGFCAKGLCFLGLFVFWALSSKARVYLPLGFFSFPVAVAVGSFLVRGISTVPISKSVRFLAVVFLKLFIWCIVSG